MFLSTTFFKYCLLTILLVNMANTADQFGLTFSTISILQFEKTNGFTSPFYITETKVSNSDDKFNWLLLWISKHGQNFTTVPANHSCNDTMSFSYHPGTSKTKLKFNGHDIFVKINHCQPLTNVTDAPIHSTLVLNIAGKNKNVLVKMMEEAQVYATRFTGELQSVQKALSYEMSHAPVEPYTVSSVILDKDVFKTILQDIDRFMSSRTSYIEKGIPNRRGYLLFGQPGCGKKSAIISLAEEINYNYFTFELNSKINDEKLIKSTKAMLPKSILVLKNINAIHTVEYKGGHGVQDVGKPKAKFEGLGNAKNSVNAFNGLLMFMTANNINELNSELTKAGYINFKQHLGPCSDYQLSKFFTEFHPEATINVTNRFVEKIKEQNKPITPADLKLFLSTNRHENIDYVFKHINDIWKDEKNI